MSAVEGLFDVGGHRLYLRCTGHGNPTVVMDAGLGSDSRTWRAVEPTLSRFTRVCVYDRAGTGQSNAATGVRTSGTVVNELRSLLATAEVPGPFVLVGHSLGGLNMHLMARQDGGDRVVGVVFVDATPAEFVAFVDSLGLPVPGPDDTPERVDVRASAAEVLGAPDFPAVPLEVLTHGVPVLPPPLEQRWQELQVAQSQLSPLGHLSIAEGAGHAIQLDRPDLVIAAVKQAVKDTWAHGRGLHHGPPAWASPAA
ncbi:MAG: alpha/beta fold hydrolase [Acidimicrobiales bacterium]